MNIYSVQDPERAVFFVGRSLRKASKTIAGIDFEFVISGSWPFKDVSVVKAATRVVQKYFELTEFRLPGKTVIMLAPFPLSTSSAKWKAETRGSSLMLLMDPQAHIENWTAQLGVIFTHEILHLWVPNSLALQGDYDWFFEGFTLYVALVTALELRLIDFQEYLDTLARVYDSYLSYADNLSLIEAAERRWTSSAPAVYDKGMLVAFLYDLIVRRESNARSTLQDRYRLLFGSHATAPGDGNEVIINLLRSSPATRDFPKSYIESRNVLELEKALSVYGLLLDSSGASSRLRVNNVLTRDQRQLLHSLGYRH
jgi:predicted metalloprotease with PDZ domain